MISFGGLLEECLPCSGGAMCLGIGTYMYAWICINIFFSKFSSFLVGISAHSSLFGKLDKIFAVELAFADDNGWKI